MFGACSGARRAWAFAAGCTLVGACAGYLWAQEIDADAHLKKTQRYLEASGANDRRRLEYDEVLAAFAKNPKLGPAFAEQARVQFEVNSFIAAFDAVHAARLSEADLDAALAFYATPEGKEIAQAQGTLWRDCKEVAHKWGHNVGIEVYRSLHGGKGEASGTDEGK